MVGEADDSTSKKQAATQRTESPASAFKKPIAAWTDETEKAEDTAIATQEQSGGDTGTKAGGEAETGTLPSSETVAAWGTIDDAFDDESVGKSGSASPAASSTVMTREERRAEMDRKREERRQRMAQLKQSKAEKLATGLS